MKRTIILIATALALLSCAKEKVAPEQRISGKFAEDGGSGLSSEYIKLEEATYTSYLSIDNKQVTFAEGSFWNSTEKTFNKHIQAGYRISSENLFIDGKDYGKIRLEGDNLTIGDKHYTRIKSFEKECYSSIVPEKTYVSVPYIQSTDTVVCSISRPIPAGKASVYTRPDFVSSASFDGEKLIFTADESPAKNDRSGKFVLSYTNAADVEIEVKQEQQTFIILPSTSVEVSYQAGTGQFSFSIENPVEGDTLSAQCESDWVHDLSVGGDNVSFSYDENNTSATRTAVITCSCSGAKAVSFTLAQSYSAPAINTDPASTTATYSGGSFSIDCTIDNPREDATITASTTSPWITGIKVEDGKMSFNVAENNSSAQRSGTIKLSYGVSGTTYATKDYTVVQSYSSSVIAVSPTSTTATYSGGSFSIDCTIDNPREDATITASTTSPWITGIKVEDGKMSFNVAENNSSAQRSGTIKLSYGVSGTIYATKDYTVTQAYSSSVITVSPTSTTATYSGGSFSIDYTIDNPREDATVTAATTSSWISGIKVENDKVSFNVAENNSSAQRSGTIKLSYGVSGTTYATKDYTVVQNGAPVTSLTLNKTSLAMNAGTSETLVATVTPSDATLVWSSSNTSVATVDGNGKVTAKANGTTTIAVKGTEGSVQATCSVTVTTSVTDVSLNKTTLSLNAGGSETLVATITPATASNKVVTWSSSNTSIATVDGNGKVTANANGTATITVKTADGNKTTTCAVTVTTTVTGVSLNKTALSLNVGSSETLIATVAPSTASNKKVTWSSSNTGVATVDSNGKVTAKVKGTATITVKTEDGGKTATCSVAVTIPVTGVSLNKTTLSLNVGSSETLIATVAPSTASNKEVTWSSSNTSVATVDGNGKVTAKAEGSATITVKTMDGNKTAECSVNVVDNSIPVDLGLSVKWAQCNLGASTPEGYGDYYAWGATEPWYKDGYAQSSSPQWKSGKSGGYSWANAPFNGGYSSYNSSYWNAHKSECVDANNTLLPANDAAHVNLGGNWRMPTKEEFDELANTSNCSWTWTTLNGIKGYKVQSKKSGHTNNWIFLPATGFRDGTSLYDLNDNGGYWSSSLGTGLFYDACYACYLFFDSFGYLDGSRRFTGLSIRPICDE